MINPLAPLLVENHVLKLVELFSGQFWTIKSQRCPKRRFQFKQLAAFYCRCKYQLLKFGHAQNAKSHDTEVSTFTFRFVSFVFGTVFRILGFDGRKQRCVVELGFHQNFPVNLKGFFPFTPASLTESNRTHSRFL